MQQRRHNPGGIIIGFYGHKPNKGVLLGAWLIKRVISGQEAHEANLLKGSLEESTEPPTGFYHDLIELDKFSDLRMKLEITWGKEIAWRRILKKTDNYPINLREKTIPFTGLDNISLIMAELRLAVLEPEWQQEIGSIAGIYLITDEKSGKHYIGSAYGSDGIWQRWKSYACTGHGNNKDLIKLLQENPGRENEFRFTLLEKISATSSSKMVIGRENFWKIALGSRRFGMNLN